MVLKALRLSYRISLPVSCGQTGGSRRVDPRFALAVWTLTFGPFAVETSVPSDACHPWLWSLSALVTVRAGWCEKPRNQPNNPTLDESAGSRRERATDPKSDDRPTRAEQFTRTELIRIAVLRHVWHRLYSLIP